MPNIIGQFCTAILASTVYSTAAFAAASVTDAGENTWWNCTTSYGSSIAEDASLTPSTSTTGCSATATISYMARNSQNMSQYVQRKKTYCTACYSGYELTTVTATSTEATDCKVTWTYCKRICDGLVCEGKTSWTTISGKGYQTRCNTSTNRCEYSDCLSGYYDGGGKLIFGAAPNCKACPTHGECAGADNLPCCDVGYYLLNNNYKEGVITNQGKDYDCLRCPALGGVYGTTDNGCPINEPEPSHITRCYIPSGKNISDTAGTYQFTQNCNYSED